MINQTILGAASGAAIFFTGSLDDSDEFPSDDVYNAIRSGEVTFDEIVSAFTDQLRQELKLPEFDPVLNEGN